jgi:metal-responsive CopG/Arc/MetJ family transcriptional regulator
MGKVTLVLDDKLEERFREAIFKSKGMRRGNMSEAFQEAIETWIRDHADEKKVKKDVHDR